MRIDDRFAADVLPWYSRVALRASASESFVSHTIATLLDGASAGMVEHLAMRTAAIDAAVTQAVDSGADQLVVLGAGLDTRVHRLALAHCDAFEVDHPDTQRIKQSRALTLPLAARSLRYVAVDFAHDSLANRLRAGGFDPARRSVWIWEGVTMYLPMSAVHATLQTLKELAAEGSTLAMTYFLAEGSPQTKRYAAFGRAILRALGEPILSTMTSDTVRSELFAAGFELVSDASDNEWCEELGIAPARIDAFHGEHLAVARRL